MELFVDTPKEKTEVCVDQCGSTTTSTSLEVLTSSKTEKGSLLWTISKYSYMKSEEHMTSPLLEVAGSQYYVILYPNGKKQDVTPENPNPNAGYLSVWGYRAPPQNRPMQNAPHRIFTFTLIHPRYEARSINCKTSMHNTAGRGYNKFISHEELENFLGKDDTLKLKFDVEVRVSISTEIKEISAPATILLPCTLKKNLQELLESGKHTDVTLMLDDGNQMKAHMGILSCRSSVFNAMFEHNMKEKADGIVRLNDLSLKELSEMLHFVYTGSCSSEDALHSLANHLFVVADRYDLPQLRNQCEASLIKQIAVENVIHLLLLAERHNGSSLKDACIEFIRNNAADLTKTDGMKQLYESENMGLLKEVMEFILLANTPDGVSVKRRRLDSSTSSISVSPPPLQRSQSGASSQSLLRV